MDSIAVRQGERFDSTTGSPPLNKSQVRTRCRDDCVDAAVTAATSTKPSASSSAPVEGSSRRMLLSVCIFGQGVESNSRWKDGQAHQMNVMLTCCGRPSSSLSSSTGAGGLQAARSTRRRPCVEAEAPESQRQKHLIQNKACQSKIWKHCRPSGRPTERFGTAGGQFRAQMGHSSCL
jgi:hypothetical protein